MDDKTSLRTRRTVITDAAIMVDGKVYSLPRPARHQDIIRDCIVNQGVLVPADPECGFLTDDGKFARRKVAQAIALAAGQVRFEELSNPGHGLFTDDLW